MIMYLVVSIVLEGHTPIPAVVFGASCLAEALAHLSCSAIAVEEDSCIELQLLSQKIFMIGFSSFSHFFKLEYKERKFNASMSKIQIVTCSNLAFPPEICRIFGVILKRLFLFLFNDAFLDCDMVVYEGWSEWLIRRFGHFRYLKLL